MCARVKSLLLFYSVWQIGLAIYRQFLYLDGVLMVLLDLVQSWPRWLLSFPSVSIVMLGLVVYPRHCFHLIHKWSVWCLVLDQRTEHSLPQRLVWHAGGYNYGGVSPYLMFPQRCFRGVHHSGWWFRVPDVVVFIW